MDFTMGQHLKILKLTCGAQKFTQMVIVQMVRTILVDFSAQKVNFNIFRFCPIVKSMISLYKLNTRGAGPISFHKF
jgi:hypothetical protein